MKAFDLRPLNSTETLTLQSAGQSSVLIEARDRGLVFVGHWECFSIGDYIIKEVDTGCIVVATERKLLNALLKDIVTKIDLMRHILTLRT